MSNIAVRVQGLGKQYQIGAKQGRNDRLSEVVTQALVSPVTQIRELFRRVTDDELIWALRGVSFEAQHGETIGVIGRNGAGKSTLLKILARITNPTEGRAELYGRVGALLEVGTGFHTELTGRENIYLKGAMLGMKRDEIARKLDEIVEFAELDTFLDTPVKRYSSGMGMRLAFAVSAHLDAEIMIVDEVLAVGDINFQNKCLGKMGEVTESGRTVLFVSHNMAAISRLCERCIWLENGRVIADGETKDVIEQYLSSSAGMEGEHIWPDGLANPNVKDFRINAIRIMNVRGDITTTLDTAEPFIIELEYDVLKRIANGRVGFEMATATGIALFRTQDSDNPDNMGTLEPGHYVVRCVVPSPLLSEGRYFINVFGLMAKGRSVAAAESVLSCELVDANTGTPTHVARRHKSLIRANFGWTRERA